MPLNIDWQQILLHLFNFIILFAVLYFLLYKPVKQFMDKRTEYYKKLDDEASANLAASERAKEEYTKKLASVDDEISSRKEKARKVLDAANAAKIKQVQDEAARIIVDARQAAERERAKILNGAQNEIADMVASATEKIIFQFGTSESYEQFLAEVERGGENGQGND